MEFSWWFAGGMITGSLLYNIIKKKPIGQEDIVFTGFIVGVYALVCLVV